MFCFLDEIEKVSALLPTDVFSMTELRAATVRLREFPKLSRVSRNGQFRFVQGANGSMVSWMKRQGPSHNLSLLSQSFHSILRSWEA